MLICHVIVNYTQIQFEADFRKTLFFKLCVLKTFFQMITAVKRISVCYENSDQTKLVSKLFDSIVKVMP